MTHTDSQIYQRRMAMIAANDPEFNIDMQDALQERCVKLMYFLEENTDASIAIAQRGAAKLRLVEDIDRWQPEQKQNLEKFIELAIYKVAINDLKAGRAIPETEPEARRFIKRVHTAMDSLARQIPQMINAAASSRSI